MRKVLSSASAPTFIRFTFPCCYFDHLISAQLSSALSKLRDFCFCLASEKPNGGNNPQTKSGHEFYPFERASTFKLMSFGGNFFAAHSHDRSAKTAKHGNLIMKNVFSLFSAFLVIRKINIKREFLVEQLVFSLCSPPCVLLLLLSKILQHVWVHKDLVLSSFSEHLMQPNLQTTPRCQCGTFERFLYLLFPFLLFSSECFVSVYVCGKENFPFRWAAWTRLWC